MVLLKKGKIQNDYDIRRTRFLGMIDGRREFNQLGVPEPDISSTMLAGTSSQNVKLDSQQRQFDERMKRQMA
jgi:hypothetical protein